MRLPLLILLVLCTPLSLFAQSDSTLRAEDDSFTVFAGDTLYAESEVLGKRESKSRPGQGIVTIVTRGYNQDGTMVCTFKRNMLIPSRGQAVEDKVGNY